METHSDVKFLKKRQIDMLVKINFAALLSAIVGDEEKVYAFPFLVHHRA